MTIEAEYSAISDRSMVQLKIASGIIAAIKPTTVLNLLFIINPSNTRVDDKRPTHPKVSNV